MSRSMFERRLSDALGPSDEALTGLIFRLFLCLFFCVPHAFLWENARHFFAVYSETPAPLRKFLTSTHG